MYTSSADVNGWILNIKDVNVTANGTLTLSAASGTIPLDAVRLYPADAQMVTNTYDTLRGITSTTDASGIVTYYTYDALGRLKPYATTKATS